MPMLRIRSSWRKSFHFSRRTVCSNSCGRTSFRSDATATVPKGNDSCEGLKEIPRGNSFIAGKRRLPLDGLSRPSSAQHSPVEVLHMDQIAAQHLVSSSKARLPPCHRAIRRMLESDRARNSVGVVSALVIVAIIADRLYGWFTTGAW